MPSLRHSERDHLQLQRARPAPRPRAPSGYLLPTASVVPALAPASFSGANITVPLGTQVYPGSTVSLAFGTGTSTTFGTPTVARVQCGAPVW